MYIGKAIAAKRCRYQHDAGSMNGCVHNAHIMLGCTYIGINTQPFYHIEVSFIHFLPDDDDIFFTTRPFHIIYRSDLFNFSDHILIMGRYHLGTIIPIRFIAIVFFRVMTCRTNHTTLAFKMTNSKTQFRCGAQGFKQINGDAIGCKNIRSNIGESSTVVSAIMCNGYFHIIAKTFFQVIGITLCGHAYSIFIHAVGTDAHDATQAACTKLKIFIKCICQVIWVGCL